MEPSSGTKQKKNLGLVIKAKNVKNTNWHIFILFLFKSKADKQQQKMSKRVVVSTKSVDFIKLRISLGNQGKIVFRSYWPLQKYHVKFNSLCYKGNQTTGSNIGPKGNNLWINCSKTITWEIGLESTIQLSYKSDLWLWSFLKILGQNMLLISYY